MFLLDQKSRPSNQDTAFKRNTASLMRLRNFEDATKIQRVGYKSSIWLLTSMYSLLSKVALHSGGFKISQLGKERNLSVERYYSIAGIAVLEDRVILFHGTQHVIAIRLFACSKGPSIDSAEHWSHDRCSGSRFICRRP